MDPALPPESGTSRAPLPAFRPMRSGDIEDGLKLCRATGWNQRARDWMQFLALDPDAARVAILDGRIVGTVATIRYPGRFAWIGMVLVEPSARGRGIGTLLLEQGLDLLADMPRVRLDATPAGSHIYRKRDFVEEYRLVRLQATIPGGLAPVDLEINAMTAADLPDVIAFDEECFGANRAAMLEWMWAGAPEYAWIARRSGRVIGCTFGRHGHLFEHLGPVVAADAPIARELARACLRHHAGRQFIIDAALHAPDWLRALEDLGFREQRPFIRMRRGTPGVCGDPSRQFAILGPEFG